MKLVAISGACKGKVIEQQGNVVPPSVKFVMETDKGLTISFDRDTPYYEREKSLFLEYKLIAYNNKYAYYIPRADNLADALGDILGKQ